jgi:hypothetical protein
MTREISMNSDTGTLVMVLSRKGEFLGNRVFVWEGWGRGRDGT